MELSDEWDIDGTAKFLLRGYNRAALQFPDEYLASCKAVSSALHGRCHQLGHNVQVFVLADTSYNSSGVDEVAAEHADADCIVHYGAASLSALSRLPAYFVFRAAKLEVEAVARQILQHAASVSQSTAPVPDANQSSSSIQDAEEPSGPCAVLVMLDQPYAHASAHLQQRIDWLRQQQQQHADDGSDITLTATAAELPIIVTSARGGSLEPIGNPLIGHPHERSCHKSSALSAPGAPTMQSLASCCSKGRSSALKEKSAASPSTSASAQATTYARHRNGSGAAEAAAPASGSSNLPSGLRSMDGEAVCDRSQSAVGLTWQLPGGAALENAAVVWVGDAHSSGLRTLQLAHASATWSVLNPATLKWQHGLAASLRRTLQRRYYLVEKARNCNIVGILVGTLGVAGYLEAIYRLRDLIHQAGKKTYTFLMGKPNPAKLANFPEVDVFVLVADPEGLILDSREYYAPLITAYEAHVAFSPGAQWTGTYRLDFDCLLDGSDCQIQAPHPRDSPRMSLVDGRLYWDSEEAVCGSPQSHLPLATRPKMQLITKGSTADITSAADYLHGRRTYMGLQDHLTESQPKLAGSIAVGRIGRAAGYSEEAGIS